MSNLMLNSKLISKKRKSFQRKQWLAGYLFLLPNFLGFLLLMLIPIFIAIGLSFTDYNGFDKPIFIGLKNFVNMFADDYFKISLKNNTIYTLTTVPGIIILAFFIAVLLNNSLLKSLRIVFFFPNITSNTAIAIVWMSLLSPRIGPINVVLSAFGVKEPPLWLASSKWALWAVIIVVIWKGMGYYMVMFLAGLQGIPGSLYEAAKIDGANRRQTIIHITLPLMTPTIFLCSVICIINSFQVFDLIYQMTSGGPGRSTNVLVYRVYQEAFQNYNFGYASAISLLLFAIIFIATIIQFVIQKRWVYEV